MAQGNGLRDAAPRLMACDDRRVDFKMIQHGETVVCELIDGARSRATAAFCDPSLIQA
jgi:hypothetical protein